MQTLATCDRHKRRLCRPQKRGEHAIITAGNTKNIVQINKNPLVASLPVYVCNVVTEDSSSPISAQSVGACGDDEDIGV